MTKPTYLYITDGGHGWLRVPMSRLTELDFVPTRCSYREGVWAYLEEDCDMSAFLHVETQSFDMEYEHHDGSCYVRRFPQFPDPFPTDATYYRVREEMYAA